MTNSTATIIQTMVDHLAPHATSLDALWAELPTAFQQATGRAVDQADDYDLALCHAALAKFDV